MKKILFVFAFMLILLMVGNAEAITCTATPSSTTIDLGSSKKVTISCTDWGSVTSVTVEPTQYNENCLSLDKSSDTITQGTTKDFTITATSMACNPSIDDRTIVWKFTPSTGSVPSKSTVVSIQSGLTITASFKQAPYSASPGSQVTIILEVSTAANEDINSINIDMSGSDSALGLTDKQISKIAASQGEKTQQVSWTVTAPSQGTYTISAVVTSQNADSDTASTYLISSAGGTSTTTTIGGGLGGGGGITTTIPKREEAKIRVNRTRGRANITIPSIAAGKMANVTIEKTEEMDITYISIHVKNSVNDIKILIKKLPGKPASVIHELTGKVYHYIQIDKENITDADINKTLIKFKVEKSWISSNRINVSTIALNRYTNKWEKLPTRKISEDATDVYFEAESPGLSVFAITGEEIKGVTTTITTTTTTIPTYKKVSNRIWIVVGALIVFAIIAFFLWRYLKPTQSKYQFKPLIQS